MEDFILLGLQEAIKVMMHTKFNEDFLSIMYDTFMVHILIGYFIEIHIFVS